MTGTLAAAAELSTGETVTFWILGPLALAGAFGTVLARNAIHSALFLVMTMASLGAFYFVQEAPFLGAVQIIVYTGAIMILFLFVLMLVGRDSSDSIVETLRGQRVGAWTLGVGFAGLAAGGIYRALGETELVGAMVLAHVERDPSERPTQRRLSRQRYRSARPQPLPGPGVFATTNSIAAPALLPDGTVAEDSISPLVDPRLPDVPGPGVSPAALESGREAAR